MWRNGTRQQKATQLRASDLSDACGAFCFRVCHPRRRRLLASVLRAWHGVAVVQRVGLWRCRGAVVLRGVARGRQVRSALARVVGIVGKSDALFFGSLPGVPVDWYPTLNGRQHRSAQAARHRGPQPLLLYNSKGTASAALPGSPTAHQRPISAQSRLLKATASMRHKSHATLSPARNGSRTRPNDAHQRGATAGAGTNGAGAGAGTGAGVGAETGGAPTAGRATNLVVLTTLDKCKATNLLAALFARVVRVRLRCVGRVECPYIHDDAPANCHCVCVDERLQGG